MIVTLPDAKAVANRAAADLIGALRQLLESQYLAHLCLTGGTVGIETIRSLCDNTDALTIDWGRVHIWWGDERFVPKSSEDRNALQAFQVGLGSLHIPDENIHEFPAFDPAEATGDLEQLRAAADEFEVECISFSPDGSGFIPFDIVLLGVGPDGHIASLFPERDLPSETAVVVAESMSPKPPALRLTFSYQALNGSAAIWVTAAGVEKAPVVADAIMGNSDLPVGRVHGQRETRWYIDESIAARLKN